VKEEPNITLASDGTYGTYTAQNSDHVLRLSTGTIRNPKVMCPKHGETNTFIRISRDNWETDKRYCTLCWEVTLIASGCGPLELVK
jgi:hypothetical protein